MGSKTDFAEVIDLIAGRYCCLLVDLPGHGGTEVSHDLDYQMSNTAWGLIELLKVLKISSCFLVGYSMGGRIALYLALHFPQYFSGVVLESASPGLESLKEKKLRIERDLLLIEKLQTLDFQLFLQQWYGNSLFASFRQHDNYQQAIARRLQNNPLKLIKSLRYLGLGVQPSLWHKLSTNQIPLLLLVGELDPKFVAINRRIANLAHQANLKIVKNSGHNIHFEQPKLYVKLITYFMQNMYS